MENKMMDYSMEKEGTMDKRDVFLGMPFAQYDYFNVSGEGLTGGFHAYAVQPGYFRPSTGKSSISLTNLGYELMFGFNSGVGFDVGYGTQKNELEMWEESRAGEFNQDYNFRFNGDMGSVIDYTQGNTEIPEMKLKRTGDFPGARTATSNNIFADISTPVSEETSDIEYILKSGSDIKNNGNYSTVPAEAIVGFQITNESGVTYTYGKSVFKQNETTISVDIVRKTHKVDREYYGYRELELIKESGKYIITDNALKTNNCNTVIGEIKSTPSAEVFLLTSITGADYVDLNDDGPTDDDFGSWTKFNYEKLNGLYRFRSPYYGFTYGQNSISDSKDDLGTVYTGEKEVYYLKTIETKTHTAEFYTSARYDAVSAPELTPEGDPAANAFSPLDISGNMKSQKLDSITLISKNRPEKPLKTVLFQYDYSLVKNVPNNINTPRQNSGKLTLKKIWFEYEGIKQAKISPYEFKYNYKNSSQVNTGKEYFKEYDLLTAARQNPNYDPFLLGAWGTVSPFAKERRKYNILLDYQGKLDVKNNDAIDCDDWRNELNKTSADFDPAAWNLKQICLPSGGEIHIQYEQKDYLSVQNKPAMVMVSLLEDYNNEEGEFTLNVSDLGIDPQNSQEILKLKTAIEKYYLEEDNNKKIYYRFLYAMKGDAPGLKDEKSEYITGYASISKVSIGTSGNIILSLNETGASNGGYTKIPKTACEQFYCYNRYGVLDNESDKPMIAETFEDAVKQYANFTQLEFPQSNNLYATDMTNSVKTEIGLKMVYKLVNSPFFKKNVDMESELKTVCHELNPCLSFIKIPTIYAKRGGGVRVKKVLIYDKGIENGAAVVYGNSYHYVLDDGKTSSGVASNEPSTAREENPFVTYLPKKDQTWWHRITTGEDKEQTEGPIGESILPAAGVVYSRVVVENINTGKTGTGFTINEFYTTKDYPSDYYFSENGNSEIKGESIDKSPIMEETDYLYLPLGIINYKVNKLWMAQGFRFIINSMNGVQEKITSYGGQYKIPDSSTNGYVYDTDGGYVISQQTYEYFEPGEKIPVWYWNNGQILEDMIVPGKEMELAAEKKHSKENAWNFSLEFDFSASSTLFPLPGFSLFPSIQIDMKSIYTHAATKIIHYPVILKKVCSYQNGMYSEQENLSFDKATGNPIVTRTTDSYNGIESSSGVKSNTAYYALNIPAFWFYSEMGKKSKNPDYKNILSAISVKVNTYGEEATARPTISAISKPDKPLVFNLNNVVNLSVQTFKKDWSSSWANTKIASRYGLTSSYPSELNDIWRTWSSFAYQSELNDQQKGLFNLTSKYFYMNTTEGTNSNSWVKASEITKYSPQGNPLEEINALGIYSSVLYDKGFGFVVPSMVAGNAQYESIYFNSFEGSSGTKASGFKAHSGNQYCQYYGYSNLVDGIYVTQNLQHSGARVFVWVLDRNMSNLSAKIRNSSIELSVSEVARVDGWILYHLDLSPELLSQITLNSKLDIYLTSTGGSLFIDDIRFQPLDAQASCFAYDNSLRLVAQFDDQHFGTYFQYNDEGQLVRKIIETERGRKTIQETQYNIPKK